MYFQYLLNRESSLILVLPTVLFCLPQGCVSHPETQWSFLLFRHHSKHTTATDRSTLAWEVSLKAHFAEKWPRSPWLQPSLCLPPQPPITNESKTLDSQKCLPFFEARRENNFGWLLSLCHGTLTFSPAVLGHTSLSRCVCVLMMGSGRLSIIVFPTFWKTHNGIFLTDVVC